MRDWSDGSEVKSRWCSCRGPESNPQHLCEEAPNCHSRVTVIRYLWLLKPLALKYPYPHTDAHPHMHRKRMRVIKVYIKMSFLL